MVEKMFIDILNPRGDFDTIYHRPAARKADLKGKTIGLIDNKKSGARSFLNNIKTFLQNDFPGIQFIDLSKKYNEQNRMKNYMDHLRGIDAAIYSTGD